MIGHIACADPEGGQGVQSGLGFRCSWCKVENVDVFLKKNSWQPMISAILLMP